MTTKIILTAIVGVFAGAFAYELLNRKQPRLVADAKNAVSDFRQAFVAGYSRDVPEA